MSRYSEYPTVSADKPQQAKRRQLPSLPHQSTSGGYYPNEAALRNNLRTNDYADQNLNAQQHNADGSFTNTGRTSPMIVLDPAFTTENQSG